MKYSLGVNLADFGFAFFEKLHHPILLINKDAGRIERMNEACRKLFIISHLDPPEVESFLRKNIVDLFESPLCATRRLSTGLKSHQLIISNLKDSNFALVEMIR